MSRAILRQHPAYRDDIGDLITRRPLPGPGLEQISPFLFLNHHGPQTYPPGNRGLPFGPHPHRGFETVTFILAGELAHLDTGGHESIIGAGGVQWMTAGSGVVHAELSPESFKAHGGPLEILQLWVNLPARLKMTAPRYTGLSPSEIPRVEQPGLSVQVISGDYAGARGPVTSLTGIFMSIVALTAGAEAVLPAPPGRNVFLYVVRGQVRIGGATAQTHALIELDEGDGVAVQAPGDALLLYGHGDPIDEPVVAHGPFVMNTREEIMQAARDYNAGRFGALEV